MTKSRMEIALGEMTDKNVGAVRVLNENVFPVHYGDAFYASVDSRALEMLRGEALQAVQGIGLDVPLNHGYNPHITLQYLEHDAPSPMQRLEPIQYNFRSLQLWVDDARELWEFNPA